MERGDVRVAGGPVDGIDLEAPGQALGPTEQGTHQPGGDRPHG
jgi:hypothetical protein